MAQDRQKFALTVDERGRNDLTVNLDAISGEQLEDTRTF